MFRNNNAALRALHKIYSPSGENWKLDVCLMIFLFILFRPLQTQPCSTKGKIIEKKKKKRTIIEGIGLSG